MFASTHRSPEPGLRRPRWYIYIEKLKKNWRSSMTWGLLHIKDLEVFFIEILDFPAWRVFFRRRLGNLLFKEELEVASYIEKEHEAFPFCIEKDLEVFDLYIQKGRLSFLSYRRKPASLYRRRPGEPRGRFLYRRRPGGIRSLYRKRPRGLRSLYPKRLVVFNLCIAEG